MADTFETLLQRIQEGTASPEELDRARALLDAFDWGLDGSPVRDAVQEVPAPDLSEGVFEALGLASEPVGAAVRAEAGDVDVSAGVFAALELDGATPLAEALAYEAGDFDGVAAVLATLELDGGLSIGEAVRAEAGAVDIAGAVLAEIGAEPSLLADALRDAAGQVDVADAVMAKLAGPQAMPAPIAAPALPAAANNTRRWMVAMLAAAMVALVLGLGGLLGGGALIGSQAGSDNSVALSGGGGTDRLQPARDMVFASASEVVVEDLSFGEDVVVFQDEGDDGALILWVDEEVL